jgi:dephospho-CoA kinase
MPAHSHPSSAEIQLQRLMQRDGSRRDAAQARLNAQRPIADKLAYADLVVDNSGALHELEAQIPGLIEKLNAGAGWSWHIARWFPPYALASAIVTMLFGELKRRKRLNSKRRR